MYRTMEMPGRIHLLCSTELYEYYVLVYVQEDGYAGRIHLLGTTELYEYYVLGYVQEDGYARGDTSARYNETV